MKKIVLVSCVKKKLDHKAKARDLYISSLFKKSLRYAKSLGPDNIYILSAKYGLLELDDEIDAYNETLNDKKKTEIIDWANRIITELEKRIDIENDKVIILAGKNYYRHIIPFLGNYELPLEGLPLGKRMSFLNKALG
jgi:cytoplasmic iron level regulating protein YaaA (DUF328/UPF0246 family)